LSSFTHCCSQHSGFHSSQAMIPVPGVGMIRIPSDDDLQMLLIGALADGGYRRHRPTLALCTGFSRSSGHCEHCHGYDAPCGCEYGCQRPGSAECFKVTSDRRKSSSAMPSTPRRWHGFDGQTRTMYHGTSREKARQILSDGLFKQSVGGMLGRGVYLSDDIEKAKYYGDVIFTVQVKVGKVAKIDSQDHPMQKSWNGEGYNSAWVPKNSGLSHRFPVNSRGLSETCVFNPHRIRIISLQ